MKVYGVAGWKNTGKTGLVTRLVAEFTARGMRVATVKHAHHSFDIDHPGRDSHRHREAGAAEVAVVSARRMALVREYRRDEGEPDLDEVLAMLAPADLVLIEGYKSGPHPKIETYRGAADRDLIAPGDSTIRAVATDTEIGETDRAVFDLNDTVGIADFILHDLGPG